MAYGLQKRFVKIIILRKVYMSKTSSSSGDPELLDMVNQYRNAIKIEENSCDERLNKESEDFAAMWYTAFPEQLDDPNYLTQQQRKSIKTIIHEKKN